LERSKSGVLTDTITDVIISLVIVTRNEERNISKCLRSIFEQDWKDKFRGSAKKYEIIVVDGGSTDKTREIIFVNECKHGIPISIIDGTGNPIGLNRNLGAKNAKGKILFFTEGDCFLRNGTLKKIGSLFQEESLIAWSTCALPSKSSWIICLTYRIYDVCRYLLAKTRLGFSLSGSVLAIRKKAFLKLKGFGKGTSMNDDGSLGRKIHETYRRQYIFSINQRYAIYRSMSRFDKGYFKALDHYIYVLTNFFPFLKPLLRNKMAYTGRKFYEGKT